MITNNAAFDGNSTEAVLPENGMEGSDTELISRLANELFGRHGAPSNASVGPGRDFGTSPGGISSFPTGETSAAPSVHPTAYSGSTQPQHKNKSTNGATESGGHNSGSNDSHAYGEPRCSPQSQHSRKSEPANHSNQHTVSRHPNHPAHSPGGEAPHLPFGADSYANPAYYFLKEPAPLGASSPQHFIGNHESRSPLAGFNVNAVRKDFPALHQQVNGKPLIWLDNAATTHKPQSVIDATSHFYSRDNSNIHRAAHTLAARATEVYEGGREKVRQFLGAADTKEIVFVRGTTEAINLVAQTFGKKNIGAGDEIVLTTMEHHANIVPWQMLAEQTGAIIRVAPINDKGELILEHFAALLSHRTKLVSVTHVANALGTINPVEHIIGISHAFGIPVLVDGAQSSPHMPINVQAMGADFFVLSGHKIFGPTGIGVLYGKAAILEQMPPWQGGGNMIQDVTFAKTTYQGIPQKFEAGTQDIAGVAGLGAAVDYLMGLGMPAIAAYEHELLQYATEALGSVPGLKPIGTAAAKASVLSFVLKGYETEQVGKHLDKHGIAVRSGHHCAQPALRRFGLNSSVRPSLAFYNTRGDVDALVRALHQLPRK